jgi:hypothetical protein
MRVDLATILGLLGRGSTIAFIANNPSAESRRSNLTAYDFGCVGLRWM